MVKNQDTENKDHILASGIHTVISQYHFTELYVLLYIPIQVFYYLQVQIWTQKLQPFKEGQQEEKLSSKHSNNLL